METTLSSKGQIVLPQKARQRLGLRPGTKFGCQIANGTIILTPQSSLGGKPRLSRDAATGLTITKAGSGGITINSEQVRAILADFP